MSPKNIKDQDSIPYQALMDENRALKYEIQSLKARLEKAEELERTIEKVNMKCKLSETFHESLNSINLTIHSILDFDEMMK